jgi:hypothetical protein
MKRIFFVLKIIIFLGLILLGYYFLYLKPLKAFNKELSVNYSTLIQNRLAFVQLTQLDPKNVNFNQEKTNLVETIRKTNKEGFAMLEKSSRPSNSLILKAKDIFNNQNLLLEKVFATKSFEEGLTILKSKESIELLTDQTNLILEYRFRLEKLRVLP